MATPTRKPVRLRLSSGAVTRSRINLLAHDPSVARQSPVEMAWAVARRGVRSAQRFRIVLFSILVLLLVPGAAQAYIGPGAGFALAGSFLAVFAAIFSAILMFLTWPMRLVARTIFGRRALARSRVKRVVVLGLDGLDHGLTEKMLA